MSCSTKRRVGLILSLVVIAPAMALAQKLEKEEKKWLDEVRPIMLPEEEKTLQEPQGQGRPPGVPEDLLGAPRPEPRDAGERVPGAVPELAEPGQHPDQDPRPRGRGHRLRQVAHPPRQARRREEGTGRRSRRAAGGRRPGPTRIAPARPSRAARSTSPSITSAARAPASTSSSTGVAESKIAQPNISYRFGPDKHLVKLADMLPKPSPAQALLKTPRQDFPVAAQTAFLKVQDGGTALLGLVRGDASGLTVADAGGKKTVKVVVAAQAVNDEGKVAAFAEQPATADVGADGSFVASYRMQLKPGKYTVEAGALDEKNGKGSLATVPVDVPSFSRGELSATMMILRGVEDVPEGTPPDSQHPFAAVRAGEGAAHPVLRGHADQERLARVLLPVLRRPGRSGHGQGLGDGRPQRAQGRQGPGGQGASPSPSTARSAATSSVPFPSRSTSPASTSSSSGSATRWPTRTRRSRCRSRSSRRFPWSASGERCAPLPRPGVDERTPRRPPPGCAGRQGER